MPKDTSARSSDLSQAIAFTGEVVSYGTNGAVEVAFENGHVVLAHPREIRSSQFSVHAPVLGGEVRIELAHDEMKGWRLARQP